MKLLTYFDIDVADVSLTGFASNVTGATFTLTANVCTDALAHQVSIRNDTANDHSGKTVTLVGTDPDGNAQTEIVTGPAGSATVESAKYFLTLTSATPSATIGADTFDIGWVDEVATATVKLGLDTSSYWQLVVTGTLQASVQFTCADLHGNGPRFTDSCGLPWLEPVTNLTNETANSSASQAATGYAGARTILDSYSSGARLEVYAIQA